MACNGMAYNGALLTLNKNTPTVLKFVTPSPPNPGIFYRFSETLWKTCPDAKAKFMTLSK